MCICTIKNAQKIPLSNTNLSTEFDGHNSSHDCIMAGVLKGEYINN